MSVPRAGPALSKTGFRPAFSPITQDENAISCLIASAAGNPLSWLRSENTAFRGPRLSEADDIEGWAQRLVTRWEQQHGPIPKKQVPPHAIG
jgi:hypothetical protein